MPLTEIDRHRIILTAAATATRGGAARPARLRIHVEGVAYDVEVEVLPDAEFGQAEEPVDLPESVLQPPLPIDLRSEDRLCRCPIAGAIVSVSARPGRFLKKDDPVAVIEAMKMQTTIGAPVDGIVEEVGITPGDSVKPGQILCKQAE